MIHPDLPRMRLSQMRLTRSLFVLLVFASAQMQCAIAGDPRPGRCEVSGSPTVTFDLAGLWTVRLDPDDEGIAARWFASPLEGGRPIALPGTTDEAGYGTPVDRDTMTYGEIDASTLVAGFGQQPDQRLDEMGRLVREHYHVGPAWYERAVEIPQSWAGGRVTLRLERTIWETRLWIDGAPAGRRDSLVADHSYPLGELSPGVHRITLRIDNGPILPTGMIQHGYGEETQTRWNGVAGALELQRTGPVWIESVRILPATGRKNVTLLLKIGNNTEQSFDGHVEATVRRAFDGRIVGRRAETVGIEVTHPAPHVGRGAETPHVGRAADTPHVGRTASEPHVGREIKIAIPITEPAAAWDEFDPVLYSITTTVTATTAPARSPDSDSRAGTTSPSADTDSRSHSHTVVETFGFRSIARDGADIRLNGRRIFLRGVLDCCIYPLTGYPPADLASWLDILGTIKAYGFNHVRFHTWCPPEAAFDAADRLGLYLAPEISFWPPGGPVRAPQLGEDPAVLDWVRREIRLLSDRYGNHPSFCFFCIGNEFAPGTRWDTVDTVLREAKTHDPRRLYNGSTARTRVAADDFWVTHVTPNGSTRGIGPPHTDWDFRKAAVDLPVISHETGQRPAFPDYDALLPKFTGPLKPYNLELYRRLAEESGIAPFENAFARASALFALDQYKAEHEALLRTPGWDGYQLLQLNDFTGQGEALVGLLDPFWNPKPGITPAAVRRWNAPTVPLARFGKVVFRSGETLEATLELAHFGPEDLVGVTARLDLTLDRAGTAPTDTLAPSGSLGPFDAPTGALTPLGRLALTLPSIREATGATLRLAVGDAMNSWRIWIYPPAERDAPKSPDGEPLITNRFDDSARETLAAGGSVLFLAHDLFNEHTERTGYASVYWSAKMFAWEGNNTLGVLPADRHPALDGFPHDGHGDRHWHELTARSTAFPFARMPDGLVPIIQAIPDFHHARPLLHLFEARVGPGRLVICGYDLHSNLADRPVAEQLRRSLLRYMGGEAFTPTFEMSPVEARRLLSGWEAHPRRKEWRIAGCDSEETAGENGRARNAIDGDPRTIWHTEWVSAQPAHPHRITIDLGRVESVTGLRYLPRQDQANGRIARYRVLASGDGQTFAHVAEGTFPDGRRPRTILFDAPANVRFVRLVALDEVHGNPWTSVAEVAPVLDR